MANTSAIFAKVYGISDRLPKFEQLEAKKCKENTGN